MTRIDEHGMGAHLRRELHRAVDALEPSASMTDRVRRSIDAPEAPRPRFAPFVVGTTATSRHELEEDDDLAPHRRPTGRSRVLRAAVAAVLVTACATALAHAAQVTRTPLTEVYDQGGSRTGDQAETEQGDPQTSTTAIATTTTIGSRIVPVAPRSTPPSTASDDPTEAPASATDPSPPTTAPAMVSGHHLDPELVTLRLVESGGNYEARNPWGNGAYGIDDVRWGNFSGYATASLAPAWIQDEAAAGIVAARVKPGDAIALVPVAWYLDSIPASDAAVWTQVPPPVPGRTVTVRQYQAAWLLMYATVAHASCPATAITTAAAFAAAAPPEGSQLPPVNAAPAPTTPLTTVVTTTTVPDHACVWPPPPTS